MKKRRALSLGWAVLGALLACGGSEDTSKTPSGARASCSADADCVVTDRRHCCAPCVEAPFAIPKLAFEQQESRCAVVDCAAGGGRIECPNVQPKDAYVAMCREGTCAAVAR